MVTFRLDGGRDCRFEFNASLTSPAVQIWKRYAIFGFYLILIKIKHAKRNGVLNGARNKTIVCEHP